ncbi:thioesterase, partial [Methylobacterium sp. WL19]
LLLRPRPAGGSVAQRIAALRRRGAHLELVYSAGDRGLAALHEALGRSPARMARRLGGPVTIIEGADHDLSPAAAQARMTEVLERLLARLR